MLARQGASLLKCVGLDDWVANDVNDYVAKVVSNASDVKKLAHLRGSLRQKVSASALFDGSRFARNFEVLLWSMWNSFQNSKSR